MAEVSPNAVSFGSVTGPGVTDPGIELQWKSRGNELCLHVSLQSSWVIKTSMPRGNVCVLHIECLSPWLELGFAFSSPPMLFPFMDFLERSKGVSLLF